MNKNRVEAFSDGVIAILITIMVLELKTPHGINFSDLLPLIPLLLSYVLSFVYLGIYWNNHHHMMHTCRQVTGTILWANLHLLFWLSLIPLTTSWLGENYLAATPIFFYGLVLFMAAVAYFILQKAIITSQGANSLLKKAIGSDWKGKASPVLYLVAILFSFASTWVSLALYVTVALLWIIPDRRIERISTHSAPATHQE